MNYPVSEYRKKVRGCFIGKSVGGTLGMPFEGNLNVNEVTYYDPVPAGFGALPVRNVAEERAVLPG